MQKIHFPYRSSTHLPLLHVIAESGGWERHGLEVDYDRPISAREAHRAVAAGEIEFVGGNHVSTYARRARGDRWVYLGQSVNTLNHRLVVRPGDGIERVADLKGRTIGSYGSHPGLNDWLFLKQNGLDEDRGDVRFVRKVEGKLDPDAGELDPETPIELVRRGKVDAYFLTPPADLQARRAGLKVIEIEEMPMIWFTTVSSGMAFVDSHPQIVERFLKGLLEGVAFFGTQPERAARIIQAKYQHEGELDLEAASHLQREIARILEAKLYPTLAAIRNVYEEAVRQDPLAREVNPMELWNLNYLRRIDDSGFIDALYR